MKKFQNYINGKFVASSADNWIEVKNPSTGELICSVPESTQQDVDQAIAAAEAM